MDIFIYDQNGNGIKNREIDNAVLKSLENRDLKKVLLVPPDFTRFHSYAGYITNTYYHALTDMGCHVDILPALGSHVPMTKVDCEIMFGDISFDMFISHDWRNDVVKIGEVQKDYLQEITEGLWNDNIDVEINKLAIDESYDLIVSVGQVVPHEVVGMANHSKNLFVGIGGYDMINKSHMVGAVYGMERMMGKDFTPVRKIFDYALKNYLSKYPILFVLTVTTAPEDNVLVHGLFIGDKRSALEEAIALAQKKNIDFVPRGIKKCVVYLDPKEFKSTWLGNKAIYRTRMAIEDGGDLIILAPGVHRFGEDDIIDGLIRKYGYCGRLNILDLFKKNTDLQANMGAAAHLIHGSSNDRFNITYAVKNITKQEIENVGFKSADYQETIKRYDPDKLHYGYNTLEDGEEIYYIPNPALGLWIDESKF